MNNNILYQDSLVEITDYYITLKKYYFPTMAPRLIMFSDIENIEALIPSIWNGKWRISGTGDFRTWFPWDSFRPKRDRIFRIIFRKSWMRSGFTVEDSKIVEDILIAKGLIK